MRQNPPPPRREEEEEKVGDQEEVGHLGFLDFWASSPPPPFSSLLDFIALSP